MKRQNRSLRFAAMLTATCAVHAYGLDAPRAGVVYSVDETHSLTYRCSTPKNNEIECSFIQLSIRKRSTPEDLPKVIKQAREEFRSTKGGSDVDCSSVANMERIFKGEELEPKESKLGSMNEIQKNDLSELIAGLKKFCSDKSEESLVSLSKLSNDKYQRTCRVESNVFSQKFVYAEHEKPGVGSWVVKSTAEGDCGVVQLSRFEPAKDAGSKPIFWTYIARKAITNPSGSFFGASCSGFDQSEHLYDWRAKENALGCDYIELGP